VVAWSTLGANNNTMNKDDLFRFMRSTRLAVISTVNASERPEAALIGFAPDVSPGLVFDTSSSSRKAQNLRIHSSAALFIGWDEETTVQIEGVATEPVGDELRKAKSLYFNSWPDGRERETWHDIAYFIVEPYWIRYSQYSDPPIIIEFDI
jgi:general stress protein 26